MWFGKSIADVPEEHVDSGLHVDEYFRKHTKRRHGSTNYHSMASQVTVS